LEAERPGSASSPQPAALDGEVAITCPLARPKVSVSYRVEQHEQWELPILKRRVGWQPSPFLSDWAEA
jgi:hypothetical protein